MPSVVPWELPAIIVAAAGVSCLLTALCRRLAIQFGLVDRPDGIRKTHQAPVPLMGGVAVYATVLLTFAAMKSSGIAMLSGTTNGPSGLNLVLGVSGLYCLLGLWDDKLSLRARYKFLFQIVAAVPFVVWGRTVEVVSFLGFEFDVGILGVPLTIFWLVSCVNAVNLVDGLDGLAGSIGTIVCLTLSALAYCSGMPEIALLSLLLSGALIGFLVHNWPPARIYLGDSGSMMIGFLIGALALESSMKTAAGFMLAVPMVLLSVPIFDTLMALMRRKLEGRGIGEPDRRHIHHRLQDSGLTKVQSLVAISGLCLVMAAAALTSVFLQTDVLAVGLCLTMFSLLIVGRIFGYDETVLFFQHIRELSSLLLTTSNVLRGHFAQTRFLNQRNRGFAEIWPLVQNHAKQIGCFEIEAVVCSNGGKEPVARLTWSDKPVGPTNLPEWSFRCSLGNSGDHTVTLTATGRTTSNTHTDRMSDRFLLLEAFCSYVGEHGLPFAAQASAASTMGRLNILNPATAPAATRSTEPRPASDAVQNRRAA